MLTTNKPKMCSHATRSLHLVHVRTSWEGKKNVKKEQITGWLFLLRSLCRPIVRAYSFFLLLSLSLSLFAFSFCLFLLPFIVFVCQLLQRTTVQTERRRKKVEGGKEERKRGRRTSAYVRARAYWTSFTL
mgnify:FL=1